MKLITKNKRAFLDYDIIETFEAWIVLKWYEVKSIKWSKVNIKDSIVKIIKNEIFITNIDIPLYEKTSIVIAPWYEQKWTRKLLLNKKEIARLREKTQKTWLTIKPLEIFLTKRWFIKVKIWLGKLRKKIEKKQILKEKEVAREASKELRNFVFK